MYIDYPKLYRPIRVHETVLTNPNQSRRIPPVHPKLLYLGTGLFQRKISDLRRVRDTLKKVRVRLFILAG